MINNTITYEQVEERLKNKPKEKWTKEDVLDRYVGYGSQDEIEDPEVQKLFVKHDLIGELIELVNDVITDKEVINKILNSNIFEDKNIQKMRGKIKDIKAFKVEDEMDELRRISIIFEKEINSNENNLATVNIKSFCLTSELDQYLQDKKKYENQFITAIVQDDGDLTLKCFCNE